MGSLPLRNHLDWVQPKLVLVALIDCVAWVIGRLSLQLFYYRFFVAVAHVWEGPLIEDSHIRVRCVSLGVGLDPHCWGIATASTLPQRTLGLTGCARLVELFTVAQLRGCRGRATAHLCDVSSLHDIVNILYRKTLDTIRQWVVLIL